MNIKQELKYLKDKEKARLEKKHREYLMEAKYFAINARRMNKAVLWFTLAIVVLGAVAVAMILKELF